jgi:hypothetical protein
MVCSKITYVSKENSKSFLSHFLFQKRRRLNHFTDGVKVGVTLGQDEGSGSRDETLQIR